MQKMKKTALFLCFGLLCGMLAVWFSGVLIRRLDVLPSLAGGALGLDPETSAYAAQVLAQLRSAQLTPAWVPVLLAGLAGSAALTRAVRKWLAVLLWSVLLLLLTGLSFWLMEVNGVRFGAALSVLFPLLAQLL